MCIPYTYLLGWSSHGRYYYGAKYARNANPDTLWKTYFTSSRHVEEFRAKYGDPDIIQIRKIFDSPDKARNWEHRVLKKMKVRTDEKWLNKSDNQFPFNLTDKSYMQTDEYKSKISSANKGKPAWNKGKPSTDKGKKFFNDGNVQRMFIPGSEPEGFVLGRLNKPWNDGRPHREETKKKIKDALTGKTRGPHSEDHRRKIGESRSRYFASKSYSSKEE